MSSVYQLKPKFQALLRPMVNRLAQSGVTANQVTVAALGLSAIASACVLSLPYSPVALLVLPLVWLVRMALNAIDGMLAREHQQQSALGCFLNEACDLVSDVLLFLPLLLLPQLSSIVALSVLFLFLLTEFTGLIAPQIGASRRYDGPLGKSDRAFLLSLFIITLFFFPTLDTYSNVIFSLLGLLAVVTVVKRVQNAIKESQNA
ncbi:MAG: CDP-alcohol phosphatidyltransferase family protein [Gammaproteobacteria bacterium]|nr:CDP-alcohol phosphatidyltransferase family protein [Gammaproteobacteria bacterium]